MNRLTVGMPFGKNPNGNFLKALAAKTGIELLVHAQLRVDPNEASQLSKGGFLSLGLGASIIREVL